MRREQSETQAQWIAKAPQCGAGYNIKNATVEVRDESNKLIGAGSTSRSDLQPGKACEVLFTIENLPRARFYQVTIGSHAGPSYTYDQLQARDWKISLSLSSD